MEKISLYNYDCVLLDIMLPGGNGFKILEALKAEKKADGVIIISARNAVDDRGLGLQMGADDYLPKPFHLSELSARVVAIIRRKNFGGNNVILFNNVHIDTQARSAMVNGQLLDLTKLYPARCLYAAET